MNYGLRFTHYALRFGLLLTALFLTACSLAEDITPPPGIELTQTAAAPAPVIPATRPDPVAGAEIFAQHCIKCHGPTGQGDGELVAQLTGRPPNFTDPATLHDRAPHEIFTIITQGRLEKTMPPFGNALTDEQRWDVTAFLFTLVEQPRESAEATFTAECAECHVNGNAPDLSALTFFATRTGQDILEAITASQPDGSHTFATLSKTELLALAHHVQALAYTPTAIAQPGPTPTPSAVITEGIGISGAVINGTANVSAPNDLLVEVFIFDSARLVGTYTTTVRNGQYSVVGLAQPSATSTAIAASIEYLGITYVSDIVRVAEGQTQFDLPIKIFETTTDPTALRISRWHVVVGAPQAEVVQVAELLVFTNAGDRALVAPAADLPTLDIPLPEGASNLQFEQHSDLYQPTPTGFGYMGVVLPGDEALQIIFAFDLPLTRQIDFVQPVRYPVEALNLLAPQTGLRVTAPDLRGPQTEDVQGTPYLAYTGSNLPANDSLSVTLAPVGSASLAFDNSMVGVFASAAVLGVIIIGTLIWVINTQKKRQRLSASPTTATPSAQHRAALVDTLARLDNDFAHGQLTETDYQRRRAKLKAEALALTSPSDEQRRSRL